jgi:hypothetical protein
MNPAPKDPTFVLVFAGNCDMSRVNHELYFLNTTQFGQQFPQYTCISSPAPFLQCAGDATCLHFLHSAGPVPDSLATVPVPYFIEPIMW